MDPNLSPSQLTEQFEQYTGKIIDDHCPTKEILTTADHKPYVTEDMKLLKRSIMREYEKRGKSSKYFKLKGTFTQKLHKEVEKYRLKIETEV